MTAYWEIVAQLAFDMFSKYKFPHLDFLSGDFFLTAPFPDHCLLAHFYHYAFVFPIQNVNYNIL